MIILVTGAARSGKSEWAEHLATKTGKVVNYIATSVIDPNDQEWQARIAKHIQRRPTTWQSLEVPVDLTKTINEANSNNCLLIDSLGTWVANLLEEEEANWEQIVADFLVSLQLAKVDVILVAEETGWGVVPAYKSGRVFRDRLGKLVRYIGTQANLVYLVTGGYALNLSALGQPLPRIKNQE